MKSKTAPLLGPFLDPLDTATNQGGANLPLGPDFTVRERSKADGNRGQNIAALVLEGVWAERQLRPTVSLTTEDIPHVCEALPPENHSLNHCTWLALPVF